MSELKWFHFDQNNSGGSFTLNDDVGEDVFIQAKDKQEATDRFDTLDNDAGCWCECCGERWSGCGDQEDIPRLYGKSIFDEYRPFSKNSYAVLHYADGRKEKVFPH